MRPCRPSKKRAVGTTSSSYLATRPERLKLWSDVLVHVMPGKDADEFGGVYRPVRALPAEEPSCLAYRLQTCVQNSCSADSGRKDECQDTATSTPFHRGPGAREAATSIMSEEAMSNFHSTAVSSLAVKRLSF